MQFTVIFDSASSIAIAFVRLTTPALAAVNAQQFRKGTNPTIEPMFIIFPPPFLIISLITGFEQ